MERPGPMGVRQLRPWSRRRPCGRRRRGPCARSGAISHGLAGASPAQTQGRQPGQGDGLHAQRRREARAVAASMRAAPRRFKIDDVGTTEIEGQSLTVGSREFNESMIYLGRPARARALGASPPHALGHRSVARPRSSIGPTSVVQKPWTSMPAIGAEYGRDFDARALGAPRHQRRIGGHICGLRIWQPHARAPAQQRMAPGCPRVGAEQAPRRASVGA